MRCQRDMYLNIDDRSLLEIDNARVSRSYPTISGISGTLGFLSLVISDQKYDKDLVV